MFKLIVGAPGKLLLLLQICGLTRSKIITDLNVTAAKQIPPVRFPQDYKGLAAARNHGAWTVAGPYLAIRLRRVLSPLSDKHFPEVAESLSQATHPGFIRQERAKRSGHEGEYRLATLLAGCSIPFEPFEKADNPLCRDALIRGESFDIVVPSIAAPRVCFKATVHTSNIGQFGESKDHLEISDARRMLNESYDDDARPLLFALVDGIGFMSNRAGLNGVLSKADEFCQYSTLWKAAVVCASKTRTFIKLELPETTIGEYGEFFAKYGFTDRVVAKEEEPNV